MTASLDPRLFQILPTRSLSHVSMPGQRPAAAPTSNAVRKPRVESAVTTPPEPLRQDGHALAARIQTLFPGKSAAYSHEQAISLHALVASCMAAAWKRAQRMIAQAAGEAQALSIIGPLADAPSTTELALGTMDDGMLAACVKQVDDQWRDAASHDGFDEEAILPAASLAPDQELSLDQFEDSRRFDSPLKAFCFDMVRQLVRERCSSLVAPVRSRIESDLDAAISDLHDGDESDFDMPADGTISADLTAQVALVLRDGDQEKLVSLLSQATQTGRNTVMIALRRRNVRGLVALAWKAGLPAHTATAIQIHIALIPPSRALMADRSGQYRLSRQEMTQQIEFLQEKGAPQAA